MKHLVCLFALALLLPACPMTTPDRPTTPTTKECPATALLPAVLGAPLPAVQPWTGQLPTLPSPKVAWVLAPADSQETVWWLFLVEVEKNYISNVYSVPQGAVGDVVEKTRVMPANMPRIFLAVLGGVRPLPLPGPIGEPDAPTAAAALNVGRASFWADGLAKPSPDQILNKVPQGQ